jgi:hypothetical protein
VSTPRCGGEGMYSSLADSFLQAWNDRRMPNVVYVFCPKCGKLCRGSVVAGVNNIYLALVPEHRPKRVVITLSPSERYL